MWTRVESGAGEASTHGSGSGFRSGGSADTGTGSGGGSVQQGEKGAARLRGTEFRYRAALNADFQQKPDRRQGMVDLLSGLSAWRDAPPWGEQPESVFEGIEVKNDPVGLGLGFGERHAVSLALLIGETRRGD